MKIERELSAALRRRRPPEGFTSRVVEAAGRDRARQRARMGRWRVAAIAAVLALLVVSGVGIERRAREQQRIAEGERAKAEVMLALKITSQKLSNVKSTLHGRGDETGASRRTQSGT